MTGTRTLPRVLVIALVAVALLADKTPTACDGPPGDTGGGGWRITLNGVA